MLCDLASRGGGSKRVKHALRNSTDSFMILKTLVNISALFSLNIFLLFFILVPFEVSSTLMCQNTFFTRNSYNQFMSRFH